MVRRRERRAGRLSVQDAQQPVEVDPPGDFGVAALALEGMPNMRQVSTEPQVPVRPLPAGDPGQHFRRQAALHEPPGVGRGAGIARPAAPDAPPRSAGRPTGGDAVLVEQQRVVGEEALAARRECGPER